MYIYIYIYPAHTVHSICIHSPKTTPNSIFMYIYIYIYIYVYICMYIHIYVYIYIDAVSFLCTGRVRRAPPAAGVWRRASPTGTRT